MHEGGMIDAFLAAESFAVAGASTDRRKFGNKVLRAYLDRGIEALPVNPHEEVVEGVPAFSSVADLPGAAHGLSIVTPPDVTEDVVEEAIEKGIGMLWMQPGAESEEAIERAEEAGLMVIHGGACVLVELAARD